MARIRHMTQTYTRRVNTFLGVNESPSGSDGLKPGEAEYMRNWRVTMDGKLTIRPGSNRHSTIKGAFGTSNPPDGPVRAMWGGWMNGTKYFLVVGGGYLIVKSKMDEAGNETAVLETFGPFTDDETSIFEFQNKIYLLTGHEYLVWDGNTLEEVEGYVPVVATAVPPSGGGTELEGANMLTPERRIQFSPDGESKKFYFPETVNYVKYITLNGCGLEVLANSPYGFNPDENALIFDTAPKRGTNTLEVIYIAGESMDDAEERSDYQDYSDSLQLSNVTIDGVSYYELSVRAVLPSSGVFSDVRPTTITCNDGGNAYQYDYLELMYGATFTFNWYEYSTHYTFWMRILIPKDDRISITSLDQVDFSYRFKSERSSDQYKALVAGMRYGVVYNGYTDSRVFLYGDGSYTTIYSGLDEYGVPRADYFPMLNQMNVGSANTPIKSMCRHYGALLCFKENDSYRISYDAQTLADSRVIAGFNIRPMNSSVGSAGYNQAVLVNNNPRTLHEGSVFEWRLNYYGGGSLRDERNAKRISDRVRETIKSMDLRTCVTYDDERNYEYWVTDGETSVIHNYGNDTWYIYTGISPTCFLRWGDKLYYGTADGIIYVLDDEYDTNEAGDAIINATWRSGSFGAGREYENKWTIDTYVGMSGGEGACAVTIQTDRMQRFPERTVYRLKALEEHESEDGALGAFYDVPATPSVHHVKLRGKSWAYLKTVLKSVDGYGATISSLDTLYRLGTNGRRL